MKKPQRNALRPSIRAADYGIRWKSHCWLLGVLLSRRAPVIAHDYQALRDACVAFTAKGIQLQTVIPVVLPAEQFPARASRQNGSSLKPAFCGKNPSCWSDQGKPQLLSHRNRASLAELIARIDVAERIDQPLGLAVIPSDDLVVVDFDLKDYASQQALDDDWFGLLDRYPELIHTRMERTPGGGIHLYLRPEDRMVSWRTSQGRLHCQFTTTPLGPHRGEVLAGRRVCVCAPTIGQHGSYELVNSDHAYDFVVVPSLGAIGITAVVQQKTAQVRPTVQSLPSCSTDANSPSVNTNGVSKSAMATPWLRELIGRKAQELLVGGRPYGATPVEQEDRSLQLTGFVKELYSWQHFLSTEGLLFQGDVMQLVQEAIAVLGVEDKADRILDSIDPRACHHADPTRALRHYQWLARGPGSASQSDVPTRQLPHSQGSADPSQPPLLSRQECTDRLRKAVVAHRSPTELELLVGELVEASELHPHELRQLLNAVKLEEEQRDVLLREASVIQQDLERNRSREPISLHRLFPSQLADALTRITEHLPYCDHVVATTYLAGVSGLVKLGTTISGNPLTQFVTPGNLYVATVGRSGQKKTPLEKLLVRQPAQALIREMAAENSRVMEQWREQCKAAKRKDERPPKPVPIYLQLQDYTGEALVALLNEMEKRGLGLLVLRDELSGLFGSMNAYRSGKGADEQQLLEVFDGHAYSSLRVTAGDRTYESCHVSIYGAIQPAVLQELIKRGDPSGQWARFLFSPLPARTQPLPTTITEEGVRAVQAAMHSLETYARRIYTLPAQQYQLDAEAIDVFSDYEHDKQIKANQARLGAQEALYGKSAAKVLRITLLLHLLRRVVLGECGDLEVPLATLQLAIELVDYLDDWALGLHERVASVDDDGGISCLMRRIHTLARKARGPVTWAQLRQQMNSKEKKGTNAVLAEQAMEALAALGVGEVSEGPRGGLQYRATAELPG